SDDEPTADAGSTLRTIVHTVLARGALADVASLPEALARGVGLDGSFAAPLVLVGADVELAFAELDVLRATVAALGPLLPPETSSMPEVRPLADAVALADAWAARHGDLAPASVAEALVGRLRDAAARASRLVPPGYLDAHVERIVLERRAFATRIVLGDRMVRASLVSPATRAAAVPAYLPVGSAARLPLFRRFAARALVEVHPRQDQFETHPVCARVLALARVVG
ncbi:MAG TPA: hypothetical protein VHB21_11125, partial [Minicystis sp.]|nr:hypothetical protein [Minicystis sp.]